MGNMQRNRRWAVGVAAVAAVLVFAACGRVNLEDLTPEAVRTQEAMNPTAAPGGGGSGSDTDGTPGSGSGPTEGDLVAGKTQYNTWCTACHDGGRAAPIKGKTFDLATVLPTMREGQGGATQHPITYSPATELTDNQFGDILAYLASETAP
jgi:mono/diheme cytochrome c family protein